MRHSTSQWQVRQQQRETSSIDYQNLTTTSLKCKYMQNNIFINMIHEKTENDDSNDMHHAKPAYATASELSNLSYISNTKISIQEAKEVFLSATITDTNEKLPPLAKKEINQKSSFNSTGKTSGLITVSNKSEDSRVTGGGNKEDTIINQNGKSSTNNSYCDDGSKNNDKSSRIHNRKVSFKTKNNSVTHRRSLITGKTTVTVTSNKVAELTRKYNEMTVVAKDNEKVNVLNQPKIARIERFQTISPKSPNNSLTPSPTLSAGTSIKIIVRRKRSTSGKHMRKRCLSSESIEKNLLSDSALLNRSVLRKKCDGNSKQKSTKKQCQPVKFLSKDADVVDGNSSEPWNTESIVKKDFEKISVRNTIKKFEYEINDTTDVSKKNLNSKDSLNAKPKLPEKKASVIVTKNVVIKDGIPKIKMLKHNEPQEKLFHIPVVAKETEDQSFIKKESLYGRTKYKQNLHKDKLSLKIVEIIQEDPSDNTIDRNPNSNIIDVEKQYEDIAARIIPNDSFLWRRKSSCLTISDADSSSEAPSYSTVISVNNFNETDNLKGQNEEIPNKSHLYELSKDSSINESHMHLDCKVSNVNSILEDLEINEALNEEIIANKTATLAEPEDDYEPFAVIDNETKPDKVSAERQCSKINCPLPEIPAESKEVIEASDGSENIYQSLLEMRSHPEGDECSMHSYEMCNNELEERTRGDGDSDDGYEYCKSPKTTCQYKPLNEYKPLPLPPVNNYEISKSQSAASTESYERIGSDAIYEKIPPRPKPSKELPQLPIGTRDSIVSSEYTSYNDGENIYDTIKPRDGASISNCYESIPSSPKSFVKMRNIRKPMATVQKRLSFDSMSNVSRSTLSSEQKTNSIYGQRSIISFSGQEIAFQVPNSDTSVSDRSDRSDDWVDMSDQEQDHEESKIIIVRERSRKSPASWSQKVRHQWQNSPKQIGHEADSSDSSHYYESLNADEPGGGGGGARAPRTHTVPHPAHPAPPSPNYDDDFDSFDSDSDCEVNQHQKADLGAGGEVCHGKLPTPPTAPSAHYTLTKFASAARRVAGKKMRELTRNLTGRHADYKSYAKSQKESKPKSKSVHEIDRQKPTEARIYENSATPEKIYTPPSIKTDPAIVRLNGNTLNNELIEKINEKRLSNGEDIQTQEKPSTPIGNVSKSKDSGTLSRKTYFSFKSRFSRSSSIAVDINSDVPGALKITNSTFYLTDSMDGDSGFSNCSDSGNVNSGSAEALQQPAGRRRDARVLRESGTRLPRTHLYTSTPELARALPAPARLERPNAPPPPPPTDLSAVHAELKRLLPSLSKKEKSPRTRTSWYAGADEQDLAPHTTATSWYAEAGLYQEGNRSSSSGASSSASPLPPSASASPLPHSRFNAEPLYQFYNAAKVESTCRENVADSDSDGYETVREMKAAAAAAAAANRPREHAGTSAMWLLMAPRGPSRTLWCQLPEVIASNILDTLTPHQRQLQEAKFELVTSEASYLNSLSVLESHFICHPAFRDENLLSRQDRETLFNCIIPVRKCSQLLMKELERCWKASVLLPGLCEIVRAHALQHFHVYVSFCQNQVFLVKTLQRLKSKPQFAEVLSTLEAHPSCQSLSLHSFLMLPMQRVTRLPLLVDAVLRHMRASDPEYQLCMQTLATLNNIVSQCNEGARNMERLEEMSRLATCIEFPAHMRTAPTLAPCAGAKPTRWLVRSGELTQLVWRGEEQLKLTFGKKFQKVPLWLFLFNDLLVITKKKGEESYVAVDYCQRSLIEVSSGDVMTQLNMKETAGKHVMLLTLLENHDNKTVEMLMSCGSETDASRWREALSPPDRAGGESVYEGWDCPQVAVLYTYVPAQPDELALAEGDIVNVTRKMPEGWYYGERIRDGETGWFPGSYTVEVASPHVRARNLKQRYRLLALSASYLGQRNKT